MVEKLENIRLFSTNLNLKRFEVKKKAMADIRMSIWNRGVVSKAIYNLIFLSFILYHQFISFR